MKRGTTRSDEEMRRLSRSRSVTRPNGPDPWGDNRIEKSYREQFGEPERSMEARARLASAPSLRTFFGATLTLAGLAAVLYVVLAGLGAWFFEVRGLAPDQHVPALIVSVGLFLAAEGYFVFAEHDNRNIRS